MILNSRGKSLSKAKQRSMFRGCGGRQFEPVARDGRARVPVDTRASKQCVGPLRSTPLLQARTHPLSPDPAHLPFAPRNRRTRS